MTTFELGINTCFAVKRWPRPADWAQVVTEDLQLDLVQHSLDLVDLDGDDAGWRRDASELAEVCAGAGLRLHSTFTGLAAYSSNLLLHPDERHRRRAEAWFGRVIDFTGAAGAPATGGHLGAFSVPDWSDPERRRFLAEDQRAALERLRRHARRRHLETLYLENLASPREPATLADISVMVTPGDASHAALELCLDVGHQCVPGTTGPDRDPYAWLLRWGKRAALIQLQQTDACSDHHWPFTRAANAAGRIDAARVLEVLARTGAERVVLVLEIIPPFEADDEEVRRDLVTSVRYWREAISAVEDGSTAIRAAT